VPYSESWCVAVGRESYTSVRLPVCLVGERVERSGADPCFGNGSNPSQVWLMFLGWGRFHSNFCLDGELKIWD
jgi:hypothetical protein